MQIVIRKQARKLYLFDSDSTVLCALIGLGRQPSGAKQREGDGKTPEGIYHICLVKPNGKFGRSLGLDYPNPADADAALQNGLIDAPTHRAIIDAADQQRRPPWGTPLGGEIYIHEGGAQSDWTQGCIALDADAMDILFPYYPRITTVEIRA